MRYKYGIISTAGITKRFIGAVRECCGTVLAASSRSLEKARAFCDENQIPRAYGSNEELYQDSDIDIVYIATINIDHVKEIRNALEHGKHVLCEKPLTLSEKDAKEVAQLAKEKNLFLMEMQKSVFLPATDFIKEYIRSKKLGNLHQIEMSCSHPNPHALWMHDPNQGGVVYGSASYTIEYLDYLLSPDQIEVQALGTREAGGAVDSVSMNFIMDEVLVNSRITMRAPTSNHAVFYFEKGSLMIENYWKARTVLVRENGTESRHEFPVEFEMKYEVEHIQECLKQGMAESPVMSKERTVRCCSIVDSILEMIEAGGVSV